MRIVIIDEPFALTKEIKRERKMLMKDGAAMNIYLAVISTEHVPGDIAEVGVYKGASAKLICEAKKGKHLHLFDTFEGLPSLSQEDDSSKFHETKFAYPLEDVQRYLAKYKNVYFYKGLVPLSAKPVEKNRFSFVHLDVDLYKSTLDCLSFFYPRLSRGGVLISHDYPSSVGVKRAFDEFFKNKPEPILLIPSNQCLIMKMD